MREYSQEELDELIECPKIIIEPPTRNYKDELRFLRKDFKLTSSDGVHEFKGFIRILKKFRENFTVALRYYPKDQAESFILLRCNGPHGSHKNITGDSHHKNYHIHKATEESIKRGLRADAHAESTKAFVTIEDAIHYFIRQVNIINAYDYFEKRNEQLSLLKIIEDDINEIS